MKTYSIKIGKTIWLVVSDKKPIVAEESKIRGIRFNKVILDEALQTTKEK